MEKFTGHVTKGDVVVVSYPFSDGSNAKIRPALIIGKSKGNISICVITHNGGREGEVPIDEEDFQDGKLDLKSFIQPKAIATISTEIVLKRIGSIKKHKLKEVIEKIHEYLDEEAEKPLSKTKALERPSNIKTKRE